MEKELATSVVQSKETNIYRLTQGYLHNLVTYYSPVMMEPIKTGLKGWGAVSFHLYFYS